MKVIDAHFHVWRQADLPWLSGPMQPRIFGPYEPIRRDYLMAEYHEDSAATGVEKSVYVQANWPVDQAEAEVAWVSRLAAETGWPHGIVGYADMGVEDARPMLDRLARYPLMRTFQDFDWADEVLHVNIARRQLKEWYAGDHTELVALAQQGLDFRASVRHLQPQAPLPDIFDRLPT